MAEQCKMTRGKQTSCVLGGPDQYMLKQDKMSMYTDNGKTLFLCPREAGRDRWQNSYDKMSIYMNIMEWGVGGGEGGVGYLYALYTRYSETGLDHWSRLQSPL